MLADSKLWVVPQPAPECKGKAGRDLSGPSLESLTLLVWKTERPWGRASCQSEKELEKHLRQAFPAWGFRPWRLANGRYICSGTGRYWYCQTQKLQVTLQLSPNSLENPGIALSWHSSWHRLQQMAHPIETQTLLDLHREKTEAEAEMYTHPEMRTSNMNKGSIESVWGLFQQVWHFRKIPLG